jgi:sugar/nucleoside kinase (ribokinase family)
LSPELDILLIGHMTVDLVAGGRVLGGTVSYAAPTYAAFGHRVGIVTSAAKDEPLLQQLQRHGDLVALPSEQSLTYENVYRESGRQQFVRSTASPISIDDLPQQWKTAPFVHLGPLAGEINPREMADGFPEATIMLTLQGMLRRWDADGLVKFRTWFDEEALRLIDIVVYSVEDINQFPQLTEEIRRICRHVVVTNGRKGGTYYRAGESIQYDSIPVEPFDLTGAGDVFAASLLGSLLAIGNDIEKAVRIAGRLAAYSVTRAGLDSAPTQAEIARELRNYAED